MESEVGRVAGNKVIDQGKLLMMWVYVDDGGGRKREGNLSLYCSPLDVLVSLLVFDRKEDEMSSCLSVLNAFCN